MAKFVAGVLIHAGILLLAASPTHAATIVRAADFPVYDASLCPCPPTPDGKVTLSGMFEPFDPLLGTLTSVSFTMTGRPGATLLLTDLEPGTYKAELIGSLSFGVLNGPTLWTRSLGVQGYDTDVVGDDGFPEYLWYHNTGTPFELFFTDGNSSFGFHDVTITDNLDLFTSAGVSFFAAFQQEWVVYWPDGSTSLMPPASTGGSLYVTYASSVAYTYVPVPESSTALLVGFGMALLAGRNSRWNARG